jgi:hypothetical protein
MIMCNMFSTGRFGDRLLPPSRDEAQMGNLYKFGSAHPSTWNAVLCDGSVQDISYTIDPNVHGYLANRHDGESIDSSEF